MYVPTSLADCCIRYAMRKNSDDANGSVSFDTYRLFSDRTYYTSPSDLGVATQHSL
jgi:hypothetical protein